MAKQTNPLNTYTPNADSTVEAGKTETNQELAGKAGLRKKGPAKVLENERAVGLCLDYLKSTEVGGREGAKGRDVEWERRNFRAGGELLWA